MTPSLYRPAALIAVTAIVAGGAALSSPASHVREAVDFRGQSEVVVVLREDGFSPRMIVVDPGTAVMFKTEQTNAFWPASDTHPRHSIYSEFDPRRALSPEESWSFVFDQEGIWSYHNHLLATQGGVVIVTAQQGAFADVLKEVAVCSGGETEESKIGCFIERMQAALKTDGLESAFDALVALYAANPEVTHPCHNLAHELGLRAYRIYGEEVQLSEKVSLCNDGFFHGYMEGFFSDGKDIQEAVAFCDRIREQFEEVYGSAGPQCDHGIGHGVAEYLLHTRPHGVKDIQPIIEEALAQCASYIVSGKTENTFRCASGIYSVMGDWIQFDPGYSALFPTEDPFYLCSIARQQWAREGCAWELSKRVKWLLPEEASARDDFSRTMSLVARSAPSFDGGAYTEEMIRSAAATAAYRYVDEEPAFFADTCRDISSSPGVQRACISGAMTGLLQGGKPSGGIERAASLCVSESLSASEQEYCAGTFVHALSEFADASLAAAACRALAGKGYPVDSLPTCL